MLDQNLLLRTDQFSAIRALCSLYLACFDHKFSLPRQPPLSAAFSTLQPQSSASSTGPTAKFSPSGNTLSELVQYLNEFIVRVLCTLLVRHATAVCPVVLASVLPYIGMRTSCRWPQHVGGSYVV